MVSIFRMLHILKYSLPDVIHVELYISEQTISPRDVRRFASSQVIAPELLTTGRDI